MREFFKTLPENFGHSFTRRNFLYHVGAIALTAVIVLSGLDWFYYLHTRSSLVQHLSWPAAGIGAIVPVFVPVVLIVFGHLLRKKKIILTGWALAQAALLGSLISSLYKAVTGRMPPISTVINNSLHFNFGFLENGIFWGWPSSHTTIAFAMSFALIGILHKKRYRLPALVYALYIGLGVSTTIHWLSEFIAGALIGTAIGKPVGKSWRKILSN